MLSVYIHIPFCKRRCNYCDFITYAGQEALIPGYVDALCNEIKLINAPNKNKQIIHSIYVGGGTPSLLSSKELEKVLTCIKQNVSISDNVEITVEVNPGTLTEGFFSDLFKLGVNRISLGGQSLRNEDLVKLGRIHHVDDIYTSINLARNAGFENISLDLIFGLPWQNIKEWGQILNEVVELGCTHLSLYDLSLEEGTLLYQWVEEGKYRMPDNDLCADMYLAAMKILETAGYEHYEISNWSLMGKFESRHNKQYWYNLPYIGFGVGAHSYINNVRLENTLSIPSYIDLMKSASKNKSNNFISPANISRLEIGEFEQMQDSMMLGLRMVKEGIDNSIFENRFSLKIEDVFGDEIQDLTLKQLCEWKNIGKKPHFRLTKKGILLANQAFKLFVGH